MLNEIILKTNNSLLGVTCFLGCFLHSIVGSLLIMNTRERFVRNCIHIPFGYLGGMICNFEMTYGIIYFMLLVIYQILEEFENLLKYSEDFSFYDIEGYIIGFTGSILYLYFLHMKKTKYNQLDN